MKKRSSSEKKEMKNLKKKFEKTQINEIVHFVEAEMSSLFSKVESMYCIFLTQKFIIFK